MAAAKRLENSKKMRDMWTFNIIRMWAHFVVVERARTDKRTQRACACIEERVTCKHTAHTPKWKIIRLDRKICAQCRRSNTCPKMDFVCECECPSDSLYFMAKNCEHFAHILYNSTKTMQIHIRRAQKRVTQCDIEESYQNANSKNQPNQRISIPNYTYRKEVVAAMTQQENYFQNQKPLNSHTHTLHPWNEHTKWKWNKKREEEDSSDTAN